MTKTLGCASLLLTLTASASAQVPAGGEFQVNTSTPGWQAVPSCAMEPDGDFIVLWSSDQSGPLDAFGQRFSASGARRGGEFLVNTYTTGVQRGARAAVGRNGGMIVVWEADSDGSGTGIKGQRYDGSGGRVGGEFLVNTVTTDRQDEPDVARGVDGRFVVTWRSVSADGSSYGVSARRYDAWGSPIGAEFVVNTYTTGFQGYGSIAMAADGRFVIVWEDDSGHDGSQSGIFGQRYDTDGARLGGEFQLNTGNPAFGPQESPSIAMSASGDFAVTWVVEDSMHGVSWGVVARRFDASANPIGFEFRVNSSTTANQEGRRQSIASDALGNFVVTWTDSFFGDAGSPGIFAQRFDASGARRGGEFHVNTFTPDRQSRSTVASDEVGNFVISWDSRYQDGSAYGVFAQRFGWLTPAALTVDTPGNRVLEPGETVDVRPSWRNANGATQAIAGALRSISGPAGATYAITDSAGEYGIVFGGTLAPCTECYAVGVSDPAARPAVHWDAAVVEGIVPDSQGQQKQWRLHVGRSFSDVPEASPFYRFVETLLHQGVTGGCSPTAYCPGASTTRDQMAVFVLVAREGAGYAPPPCTTPLFADVPASNPFCRWIEELARRSVVSGCGGGNYCPASAVTREQMAVFVLRTLDATLAPPACVTPIYSDVPAASPFCPWIEELTRRSVVSGCGNGRYCPSAAVTREQMGVFLGVTFGLTLYGP